MSGAQETLPQTPEEFRALMASTVGQEVLQRTEDDEVRRGEREPAAGATPAAAGAAPPAGATPAPAQKEGQPGTPPGATTAPAGEKLIFGKFKDMETAEKGHHLLIQNFNAVQHERDELRARLAASETPPAGTPPPVTPGRADPTQVAGKRQALTQKFTETYGIDPADVETFVQDIVTETLEKRDGPRKALEAADAYMAETYPEFPPLAKEVAAFVQANPKIAYRVADEWNKGNYVAGTELAWLYYDNARRAAQITETERAQAASASAPNKGDRSAASLISTQAGGAHETVVQGPVTEEDWERMRAAYKAGYGNEFRAKMIVPLLPPEVRDFREG